MGRGLSGARVQLQGRHQRVGRAELGEDRAASQIFRRLATALGTAVASDWTTEHAAYFRAIRLEKTMMTVILLLIVYLWPSPDIARLTPLRYAMVAFFVVGWFMERD